MARYDRRIATRITDEADSRLRVAAALKRIPLSALLTEVIVQMLPPAHEQAAQQRRVDVEMAS